MTGLTNRPDDTSGQRFTKFVAVQLIIAFVVVTVLLIKVFTHG